jgi:hypothetical protein
MARSRWLAWAVVLALIAGTGIGIWYGSSQGWFDPA